MVQLRQKSTLFAILSIITLILITINVSAHSTGEDVYVRVVSANPDTKTYSFSCEMSPDNNYLRDWFIRPDNGDMISDAEEQMFLDLPAGQDLTYTFQENTFYHVGCLIVNGSDSSQLWRGDLHIDLRDNGWNPEIIPVSGSGLSATYQCNYNNGDYSVNWQVLDAQTGEIQNLGSQKQITHSVNRHGLYDYICHVNANGQTFSTGLPIEYFDSGNPYFPDELGVPHGVQNIWDRSGDNDPEPPVDPPMNNTNQTDPPSPPSNTSQTGLIRIDTDSGLEVQYLCKPQGSSDSLTVDWNFGDGNEIFDTDKQISHSYIAPGNYFVQCGAWDNAQAKFTQINKFFTISGSSMNNTNQTDPPSPPSNNTNSTIPSSSGLQRIDTDSGLHAQFSCKPEGSSNNLAVDWNFGDGQQLYDISEIQSHQFSSPGNYFVQCDVWDNIQSEFTSFNKFFTISGSSMNNTNQTDPPSPPSNTSQTGLIRIDTDSGLEVQYLCKPQGSSDSLTVDWNFGDGNEIYDIENVVIHNYASPNTYFVQCDVWDNIQSEFTSLATFITVSGSSNPQPQSQSFLTTPVWLSHTGATNIAPDFFHLEVSEQNKSIHSTSEWEIWDMQNQKVWQAYNVSELLRYHIHTPDGDFVGPLDNANQLNHSTEYQARVRFKHVNGSFTSWSDWRTFTTSNPPVLNPSSPSWTAVSGFKVEKFASDLDAPVHVKKAPNIYTHLPLNQRPFLYVTELYGDIKVIYSDGSQSTYASNLLNFDPFGSITGAGQMGLIGLEVDPNTGDLFAGLVYIDENDEIKNKVIKFNTNNNGNSFDSQQTLIDNLPSAPSHQVEALTLHNGRLYINLGDAQSVSDVQNDNILVGKIISINPNGGDLQTYAKGFRNPFGADWRDTGVLYVTDNAPDVGDKLVKVTQNGNYGWGINDNQASFDQNKIATLNPSPADVEFNYDSSFSQNLHGRLYVAVAGPIYQKGPTNGKQILEFQLDNSGNVVSQREFVKYTGTGYGTPIGLEFANGALYFTDIYGEPGFVGLGETEGNIYKIIPGTPDPEEPEEEFRAGISIVPWYPKDTGSGIEYIFECQGIDGSEDYLFDIHFGNGNKILNTDYPRHNQLYPYGDQDYTVSCIVTDQETSQTDTATLVVNPSDFIEE